MLDLIRETEPPFSDLALLLAAAGAVLLAVKDALVRHRGPAAGAPPPPADRFEARPPP